MKKQLTIFLMFLSLALTMSCGKDYNALFQERVAQLNKEGKYILSQYNDYMGKEHYIVYMDDNKIVLDTLGDSTKVYPLGNIKRCFHYDLNADKNGKYRIEKREQNDLDWDITTDNANKQLVFNDHYYHEDGLAIPYSELKVHKRDYILIQTEDNDIILFLNKELEVLSSGSLSGIYETENGLRLNQRGNCQMLFDPGVIPWYYTDLWYGYSVFTDSHGNITGKSDSIEAQGVKIPFSELGTPKVNEYVPKIILEASR